MTIVPGARLGAYEILSGLGAGGMGEVYRARDMWLGRDVAIKVLPAAFTSDVERLARFEREARMLAALNHPHIAAIYSFEQSPSTSVGQATVHALVLELVDGPTLGERLTKGPVPVKDALEIARQIAEALEAAHENGIVHRDLKPANIKITDNGIVKVLDFGLAKMLVGNGAGPDLSQLPTATADGTRDGVIMGTAAYMSPEQARGKPLDKRTDIWAFGCVLYEMLTGQLPFPGDTISDTIAAILEREPKWGALPTRTPLKVHDLLRRCLQKNPNRRLRDIGDARIEIEEAQSALTGEPVGGMIPPRAGAARRAAAFGAAVALLVGGIAAGTSVWLATRPPPPRVTRFTITPPAAAPLTLDLNRDLAIAPDGTRVVYAGANGTQLVVHALDQLVPRVLSGLGAPSQPVFSPDGQWIAFFDGVTALKKVATTGGPAVTLCPINGPANGGMSWGTDDTIVFTAGSMGLLRVAAAGGEPEVLTMPDRTQGELNHLSPEVLPGGEAVLFTITKSDGPEEPQVAVLDLRTGARKVLVRGGRQAQYVAPGYLIYAVGSTLRAVAFDLGRLEVLGSPVPVVEDVMGTTVGASNFSVAVDGTLAYVPGRAQEGAQRTLAWVDRQGREEALPAPPRAYVYPRLSPDGLRLALSIYDQEYDLWIWDLSRQTTLTRFTFDAGVDLHQIWTPDGRRLVWGSMRGRGGPPNLYWKAADGTGAVERLTETESPLYHYPYGFSPDGTRLLLREGGSRTGNDLATLRLDGERPSVDSGRGEPIEPRRVTHVIRTAFSELNGEITRDGRWLAYESNESGEFQIYVRPFPDVEAGKWQVSTGGGQQPLWARSGRELFYRARDGALMGIPVETVETIERNVGFSAAAPASLVRGQYYRGSAAFLGRTYDVSPDGQRFLMIKEGGGAPPTIVVVQNWHEELKRLVPVQ